MTTIGEEKRYNPRFAGRNREQFIEVMNNLKLPAPQKIMEALSANEQCGVFKSNPAATPAGDARRQVLPIQAAQLKEKLTHADTLLIDVREPGEFAREHIAGAQSVPLSTLDAAALPRDKSIVVCCQVGSRSRDAATQLASAGFDVFHLKLPYNQPRPRARSSRQPA